MTGSVPRQRTPGAACPGWCVADHGAFSGEEAWVHLGEPLAITEGVAARLCLSVDPVRGTEDGPVVVVGSTEYSLAEIGVLGQLLLELATTGAATRPAAV